MKAQQALTQALGLVDDVMQGLNTSGDACASCGGWNYNSDAEWAAHVALQEVSEVLFRLSGQRWAKERDMA